MTKTTTCETVRDALPAFARGTLEEADAAGVREHLAACPSCAAELELARVLMDARQSAPAGLAERVLVDPRALRPVPAARPQWVIPAIGLAAAAVLALVLAWPEGGTEQDRAESQRTAAVEATDPFLEPGVLADEGEAVTLALGPIAEDAATVEQTARADERADLEAEAIAPLAMDLADRSADWPGADGASAGAMMLDDLTYDELELLLSTMERET